MLWPAYGVSRAGLTGVLAATEALRHACTPPVAKPRLLKFSNASTLTDIS